MGRSFKALVSAIALLGVFAGAAHAQGPPPPLPLPEPKVVPMQVTGPPSQRLNMIILGDGYQWDQQSLFRADVDRNLAVMWSTEPFRSYRNYINIYAVELASIDYGTRCDPDGRVRSADGTIRDTGVREGPINTKNTALRLTFDGGCTNPLARGTVYTGAPAGCNAADLAKYYPAGATYACETGNQAHTRIINNYVAPALGIPGNSQNLQTLAIFNTFTYGGIGGTQATTSGGSPQGPLISLHELGHSLGTLADEYPYSSRDVIRPCYTGGEPSSFHHTILTAAQMLTAQTKWWRWIGEESISGGKIGTYEGGGTFPCGQRRPSQHSMMRWIGFDLDQIGRENMVARITGMRNSGQMNVQNTPAGTVAKDSVLWVETGHPRFHEVNVTWRKGGPTGEVIATGPRNLDLEPLNLPAGTVISAEIRDPVGPSGIDWVRNPSTNNAAADSGFNGPRFVQTRTWTVGDTTTTATPAAATISAKTATTHPVAKDEVVYVETNHPNDRVLPVTWTLNGTPVANPANSRNLDLGKLNLPAGTHTLKATVTDGALSDSVEWKIDNVAPTAHRRLSDALTTSTSDGHRIYFNGWDMWLDPADDRTGYEGQPAVVGQLRLNKDGWFNYFGFPEQPMPESPFQFRHSGTVVKALTYGNLGTGGLSKAGFEQDLPDDHPAGGFIPGFGTHLVEHRAIDPAGNYSQPESYTATALPGGSPACTTTVTGAATNVNATTGVTCLNNAQATGNLTVGSGASVVISNSTVGGTLTSTGAQAVQVIGSTVNGLTRITGTTNDVTLAGSTFNGGLNLTGNTQVSANDRYSRLAGAYGPVVAGNTIRGGIACAGNSADVKDFGAKNVIGNSTSGCAIASGVDTPGNVGGNVPATLSLTLGPAATFGSLTPGVAKTYFASTAANVISTAGDALLSVSDPSSTGTGHLVNGSFVLPEPLQARARNAANTGTAYNNINSNLNLLTWSAPISNDAVTIEFSQLVKANDPLRTGTYSKALTFTLSTTTP